MTKIKIAAGQEWEYSGHRCKVLHAGRSNLFVELDGVEDLLVSTTLTKLGILKKHQCGHVLDYDYEYREFEDCESTKGWMSSGNGLYWRKKP